ncbi:hypothetical protein COO60DRAFT_1068221 [Scenedesmus sp. NREL 46B-D3]|nr:hypothetical protein COO60DRAFT_1068221 [Scenedesmus sp. NREL 46B-D3]
MASKAATLGDPRRPAEVKPYVRSAAAEEGPHPLGLLSLLLGLASMVIKVKVVGWTALFVSLCAIMHIPPSHNDFKQTLSSSM